MRDADCLFCKIVAREIPADIVLESDNVLAFRDVNPQAPVHALVVPKDHVRDASTIEGSHGDLLTTLIGAANEIAHSEGVDSSGYRLVLNVGPDAGQTVFHLHLHVLGGRAMAWPPG